MCTAGASELACGVLKHTVCVYVCVFLCVIDWSVPACIITYIVHGSFLWYISIVLYTKVRYSRVVAEIMGLRGGFYMFGMIILRCIYIIYTSHRPCKITPYVIHKHNHLTISRAQPWIHTTKMTA